MWPPVPGRRINTFLALLPTFLHIAAARMQLNTCTIRRFWGYSPEATMEDFFSIPSHLPQLKVASRSISLVSAVRSSLKKQNKKTPYTLKWGPWGPHSYSSVGKFSSLLPKQFRKFPKFKWNNLKLIPLQWLEVFVLAYQIHFKECWFPQSNTKNT